MLRLHDMPPSQQRVENPTGVFDENGVFQYPPVPPGYKYLFDPRLHGKKKAAEKYKPDVVNLMVSTRIKHFYYYFFYLQNKNFCLNFIQDECTPSLF